MLRYALVTLRSEVLPEALNVVRDVPSEIATIAAVHHTEAPNVTQASFTPIDCCVSSSLAQTPPNQVLCRVSPSPSKPRRKVPDVVLSCRNVTVAAAAGFHAQGCER